MNCNLRKYTPYICILIVLIFNLNNSFAIEQSNAKLASNSINREIIDTIVDDAYLYKENPSSNELKVTTSLGYLSYVYGKISTGKVEAQSNSKDLNRDAICNVDILIIRSSSSIDSLPIDKVYKGEKLKISGKSGEWYEVKLKNGKSGWVSSENIIYDSIQDFEKAEEVKQTTTAKTSSNTTTTKAFVPKQVAATGNKIVDVALKYEGCYYRMGGESPPYFDCSGYVKYVFNEIGVKINRVAADQAKQGTFVAKSDLIAGDVVFFDTDGGANYINHVGIYIGDGIMIHASSPRSVYVKKDTIMSGFYAKYYMTARRM